MTDLDEELRHLRLNLASFGDDELLSEVDVANIKQAFKDAGWVHKIGSISGVNIVVDPKLMTGQEWYYRFEDEFLATKKPTVNDEDRERILDAARKASGIE